MAALTIFNHGTGFGRVKGVNSNELVAWLHEHASGTEVDAVNGDVVVGEYIINDGPGSGANNPDLPGMNNPYTGERKGHESFKHGKSGGDKRTKFARDFAGETGKSGKKYQNAMGNFGGAGWTDNVARSLFLLQSLIWDKGVGIDTVNMCGWSRGGVTCIRIANKMYEVFGEDVRVNIFAVDPVAGKQAGNTMQDTRVIPANVDHFFAILAMHEMRKTFKPQDLSRIEVQDPGQTRVLYLPMPGVHNEQVISSQTSRESAEVSRSLAYGFLQSFGTRFDGAPSPFLNSPANMALHYAKMVLDLGVYHAHQTSGTKNRLVGGGLRRRAFNREEHAKHYVTGGKGSYWVNEHHRACFKRAFPNLYADIFRSDIPTLRQLRGYGESAYCAKGSHLAESLTRHGMLEWYGNGPYDAQVVGGSGHYADTRNTPLMQLSWPAHIPLHG
jgi:hypothetical protein